MNIRKGGLIRIISSVLVLILVLIILPGCWDNRDVTDINFVTAIGHDVEPESKELELTIQIAKPSALEKEGKSNEKAFFTHSFKGATVFEAIRSTLKTINKKLFFTHSNLIVIGEEQAREGIQKIIDLWERDPESNIQAKVLLTKDTKAKDILMTGSELDKIPSMHLVSTLENNQKSLGTTFDVDLFHIFQELPCNKCELLIPEIILDNKNGDTEFRIEGSGVFRKDKLVGWLSPIETRGFLFADDKIKSAIITVPNPLVENMLVSIEVTGSKAKRDVSLIDGEINLTINIETKGNIGGQQGAGDLTTTEMIKTLEDETAKVIEEEIRETLKAVKNQYKSDVLAFGHIIHRKYLGYWKDIEDSWAEVYSEAPIEINVKVKLERSGYIKEATEVR